MVFRSYVFYTRTMAHYSKEKSTKSGLLYWVFGEEKQTPILLIPGFTGTHKDVARLANILKEKYKVVIPEFPGWEDASREKSTYTVSSYAKIIKEIIDELGFKNVPLVAHCMGAAVALETAYDYPHSIQKLILISTPYQDGTWGKVFFLTLSRLSEKVPAVFRPLFFFWRSRVITTPMSFFVLKTKTMRKKLRIMLGVFTNQSHQNEHVLETNWDSLIAYDYQKLTRLKMPIHLLHGEEDILIPPQQAKQLVKILPHATFEVIPHAGHLPPVETPETTAVLIEKYL